MNRGGSWNNTATNCRVANRNNNTPSNRNNNLGFRLAPQLSPVNSTQFREEQEMDSCLTCAIVQQGQRIAGTCFLQPMRFLVANSLSERRSMVPSVLHQHKSLLTIRLVTALLLLIVATTSAVASTRRALVFGLGQQQDTRWGKIHGDLDVLYVGQMLKDLGYTDVTTLTNEQATKVGMVDAFMSLATRCRKGDVVYIHYSGHGQLMTDLDGDEALRWGENRHAAWDEAWIPYDAYMTYCPEDQGEKHFCDDEVAAYLTAIRKRIGRHGQLTVVIDACHSGDATAANEDEEECIRGIDTKFNIPREPERPQVENLPTEEWRTISACKPYQLCTEIKKPQVGKLTYALYTLGSRAFRMDNEQLQQALERFMEQYKGRLVQTPVVVGER